MSYFMYCFWMSCFINNISLHTKKLNTARCIKFVPIQVWVLHLYFSLTPAVKNENNINKCALITNLILLSYLRLQWNMTLSFVTPHSGVCCRKRGQYQGLRQEEKKDYSGAQAYAESDGYIVKKFKDLQIHSLCFNPTLLKKASGNIILLESILV